MLACFLAISRSGVGAKAQLSLFAFKRQLSRPPTCSTERSPFIETRSLTERTSEWTSRNVLQIGQEGPLVLLLGGNVVTHLPALAGSSQMPNGCQSWMKAGAEPAKPGGITAGGAPVNLCGAAGWTRRSRGAHNQSRRLRGKRHRSDPENGSSCKSCSCSLFLCGRDRARWANILDLSYNRDAEAPIELRVNPVEVGTTNTTVQTPALRVNDGSAPAPAPAPATAPAAAPAPAPAPAPATNGQ